MRDTSRRRATKATRAPGANASRYLACFSATDQRRRRSRPTKISARIPSPHKQRPYGRNFADHAEQQKAAQKGRLLAIAIFTRLDDWK